MNTLYKRKVDAAATENGWDISHNRRIRLERDGYEIYFQDGGGFDLTMRDPETRERYTVFERRGPDIHSPLYVALLIHIIENVERVVSEV